jgi:3-hydroxyisobutyrate dehydrogenase
MEKYQVGIVGVGNMGGGMARNLLAKGWPVSVCDIDHSKVEVLKQFGAVGLEKPAQAAINSVVTIVCVIDAKQTHDVLFGEHGITSKLKPGATVMMCPTLAPEDVEGFAQSLQPLAVRFIDAPMSGGPARAADGSMSLMVACRNEVFEQHNALLNALSNRLFHVSQKPGDGARTKLVNNLLAGINLVGAAEALAMAKKMGLDLDMTMDVIEQSSGQSWVGSDRMRRAFAGDYAPRAHMTLLEKDTRLAVSAAKSAKFEGPLGAAAAQVFAAASAGGLEREDDAALFKWLQRP